MQRPDKQHDAERLRHQFLALTARYLGLEPEADPGAKQAVTRFNPAVIAQIRRVDPSGRRSGVHPY